MLEDGVGNIVSALEMSHWDVALAAGFLLDRDKARSRGNGKTKCRSEATSSHSRSEYSSFVYNDNFTSSDSNDTTANNNQFHLSTTPADYSHCAAGVSGNSVADVNNEHIRPTRV